jgi:FtsP/CotA-like multicopper oxidase with cupredoxin domain
MDGVPGLTQPEIPPGGEFVYEFDVPDAGTFWYHPHVNSAEQVGRGLAGAFVVEERNPPRVDRDLTWVLTDWRLTKEGAIAEDFGHPMDLSHAGRLGNTATLNGQNVETFAVRSGERLRLRLVNTASARVFGLVFEGHRPRVIALDGQPVEPHEPEGDRVVVPPGQRVDLILDMTGRPGDRAPVVDTYYANTRYKFIDLAYDERPPLRPEPLPEPAPLAPNPLPEPDVANTLRREIVLHGGAMQQGAHTYVLGGQAMDLRALFRHGKVWAINGVVDDHNHQAPPLATVERGRTVVLAIRNESMWEHPMHLHGFAFRILSYDGQPAPRRPWADTVFLKRLGSAEIAFVADSPGDWLFHCHVLEHHMAGMSAVLRVT